MMMREDTVLDIGKIRMQQYFLCPVNQCLEGTSSSGARIINPPNDCIACGAAGMGGLHKSILQYFARFKCVRSEPLGMK